MVPESRAIGIRVIRPEKDESIRRAHQGGRLANNARDGMKHLYDRLETVYEFTIPITICLELICFALKDVEDGVGRVAVLEGFGRGMSGEVYTRLFGIIGQGSVEYGLKIGRGHGKSLKG
jgi:hypothetical protein